MEQLAITVFGFSMMLGNIDYLSEKRYYSEHEQKIVCDMYLLKKRRFRLRDGDHNRFIDHSCGEVVDEIVRISSLQGRSAINP